MSLSITKPLSFTTGTFARASTAWYFDSSGNLQSAAAGALRVSYDPTNMSAGPAVMFEPNAATNYLKNSGDPTTWGGCTKSATTDKFGNIAFVRVAKATTATGEGCFPVTDTISVAAGSYVTTTIALLAGTQRSSNGDCYIGNNDSAGSAWGNNADSTAVILGGPGVLTQVVGGMFNVTGLDTVKPTLIAITRYYANAMTTARLVVYPGTSLSTTIGDDIKVTRGMLEIGKVASSYIPTTTTAVTRAAESLTSGGMVANIPETDYPAYVSTTAYTVGQRVMTPSTHQNYECVQAATGKDPTLAANSSYWLLVGPTNLWATLDTSSSTQTSQAGGFSYVFQPGQAVTAAAVLNIKNATSVRLRLVDPTAGVVYDKTTSLIGIIPNSSWYDYYFSSTSALDQVLALDLPPYSQATLLVDVYGSGTPAAGVIMTGYQTIFSPGIKYGARGGITDYSRKETDNWGNQVLQQRAYSKIREWALEMPNTEIDAFERTMISLRAVPCLYVGNSGYSVGSAFAFYKDFDVTISYPSFSDCTLTLEGMT